MRKWLELSAEFKGKQQHGEKCEWDHKMGLKDRKETVASGVMMLAVLIGLCYLASIFTATDDFAPPHTVAILMINGFWKDSKVAEFSPNTGFAHLCFHTAVSLVGSVITGALAGLAVSLAIYQSRIARLVNNITELLRVIPPLVVAPIVLTTFLIFNPVFLGFAPFVVAAIYATCSSMVYANNALNNVADEYLWTAQLYGAGRWKTLLTVYIPGMLGEFLGGLKVVASTCLGIVMVVEFFSVSSWPGLGYGVSQAYQGDILLLEVIICYAILLTIAIDVLLSLPKYGWQCYKAISRALGD